MPRAAGRGRGYKRSQEVPMQARRRQSDARWRANVASCFETLKQVIPVNKRACRRQISKAAILQETQKHIEFLETTLCSLIQARAQCHSEAGNEAQKTPQQLLADVHQDFIHKQQEKTDAINKEKKYKSQRYKMMLASYTPSGTGGIGATFTTVSPLTSGRNRGRCQERQISPRTFATKLLKKQLKTTVEEDRDESKVPETEVETGDPISMKENAHMRKTRQDKLRASSKRHVTGYARQRNTAEPTRVARMVKNCPVIGRVIVIAPHSKYPDEMRDTQQWCYAQHDLVYDDNYIPDSDDLEGPDDLQGHELDECVVPTFAGAQESDAKNITVHDMYRTMSASELSVSKVNPAVTQDEYILTSDLSDLTGFPLTNETFVTSDMTLASDMSLSKDLNLTVDGILTTDTTLTNDMTLNEGLEQSTLKISNVRSLFQQPDDIAVSQVPQINSIKAFINRKSKAEVLWDPIVSTSNSVHVALENTSSISTNATPEKPRLSRRDKNEQQSVAFSISKSWSKYQSQSPSLATPCRAEQQANAALTDSLTHNNEVQRDMASATPSKFPEPNFSTPSKRLLSPDRVPLTPAKRWSEVNSTAVQSMTSFSTPTRPEVNNDSIANQCQITPTQHPVNIDSTPTQRQVTPTRLQVTSDPIATHLNNDSTPIKSTKSPGSNSLGFTPVRLPYDHTPTSPYSPYIRYRNESQSHSDWDTESLRCDEDQVCSDDDDNGKKTSTDANTKKEGETCKAKHLRLKREKSSSRLRTDSQCSSRTYSASRASTEKRSFRRPRQQHNNGKWADTPRCCRFLDLSQIDGEDDRDTVKETKINRVAEYLDLPDQSTDFDRYLAEYQAAVDKSVLASPGDSETTLSADESDTLPSHINQLWQELMTNHSDKVAEFIFPEIKNNVDLATMLNYVSCENTKDLDQQVPYITELLLPADGQVVPNLALPENSLASSGDLSDDLKNIEVLPILPAGTVGENDDNSLERILNFDLNATEDSLPSSSEHSLNDGISNCIPLDVKPKVSFIPDLPLADASHVTTEPCSKCLMCYSDISHKCCISKFQF